MYRPRQISAISLLAIIGSASVHAQVTGPTPARSASREGIAAAAAAFKAGSAAYAKGDLQSAHSSFAKVVRLAPDVGAGHSALGAVLLSESNLEAATVELQRARELDPKDLRATINLAETYFRQHDFVSSVATFRLLPEHPADAAPLLTSAETISFAGALAATGDTRAAQQTIEAALGLNAREASLHDALGTLLVQSGRNDEAGLEFERALVLDPNLALAHFHLGSLDQLQSRPKEAVSELTSAAKLDPNNVDYAIQLGRALGATGQDAEAIADLRRALTLHPDSIDARYALALALQSGGQPREALPLFNAVVVARPNDSFALTNKALALVQIGEAQSALAVYEKAIGAGGDSSTLREDLGVAHLQLNELDRAIDEFHKGLALDAGNPHLHYDLGLALKLKDKPNEAMPELLDAERIDPSLPDPPYTLGVLYMQLGRPADAQSELEKATSLRAENGEAWALLGNVYKQSDQLPKAKLALGRASMLLPNQPGPHITLAAILAQEGDTARAASERKIAADLSRAAYAHQRATFALESGRALLKKGDLPGAVAQLQASTAAEPSLPEPHLLLAEALTQQHKPVDAALERKKAQDAAGSLTGSPALPLDR